jgi:hypothetical protein
MLESILERKNCFYNKEKKSSNKLRLKDINRNQLKPSFNEIF